MEYLKWGLTIDLIGFVLANVYVRLFGGYGSVAQSIKAFLIFKILAVGINAYLLPIMYFQVHFNIEDIGNESVERLAIMLTKFYGASLCMISFGIYKFSQQYFKQFARMIGLAIILAIPVMWQFSDIWDSTGIKILITNIHYVYFFKKKNIYNITHT
eukprot:393979_1